MNIRKFRLVLECAKLIAEIARLMIVLWNVVFNYARPVRLYAREMVQ
jgi:hypothetical protein